MLELIELLFQRLEKQLYSDYKRELQQETENNISNPMINLNDEIKEDKNARLHNTQEQIKDESLASP